MTTSVDHSLNHDTRQREMLAAMGVTHWWPDAAAVAAPVRPAVGQPRVSTPAPPQSMAENDAKKIANNAVNEHKNSLKNTANSSIYKSEEAVFHSNNASSENDAISPLVATDWPELTQAIQHCTACGLCQGRGQSVVGMGNPRARWLIVGEAPDEQEDKQGQPFVGAAGQLLDAALAAMGLTRGADVYLTNVVKCRPPHNRNPEPAEVARCAPYLRHQIELVQPDIVLAMGRLAAQAVLADAVPGIDKLPLGKLRRQVHTAAGRPVVVTYPLTYLLRNPAEKGEVWSDLCLAMAHLGYNPLARYTPTA